MQAAPPAREPRGHGGRKRESRKEIRAERSEYHPDRKCGEDRAASKTHAQGQEIGERFGHGQPQEDSG
jgi:hypothetical protein